MEDLHSNFIFPMILLCISHSLPGFALLFYNMLYHASLALQSLPMLYHAFAYALPCFTMLYHAFAYALPCHLYV